MYFLYILLCLLITCLLQVLVQIPSTHAKAVPNLADTSAPFFVYVADSGSCSQHGNYTMCTMGQMLTLASLHYSSPIGMAQCNKGKISASDGSTKSSCIYEGDDYIVHVQFFSADVASSVYCCRDSAVNATIGFTSKAGSYKQSEELCASDAPQYGICSRGDIFTYTGGAQIDFEEPLMIDNGLVSVENSLDLYTDYTGYVYRSSYALKAICCRKHSGAQAIKAPQLIPLSDARSSKPQYTFGVASDSGKDWTLAAPEVYGFVYDDVYLYMLPLSAGTPQNPQNVPKGINLNAVGTHISFVDTFAPNVSTGIQDIRCVSSVFAGMCGTYNITLNNGTETSFDASNTPLRALADMMRVGVPSCSECHPLYGQAGFTVYSDGGYEYLAVRVSNGEVEWKEGASVSTGVQSNMFTGYSHLPKTDPSAAGNFISVGSFLSTSQVSWYQSSTLACAVSDDEKDLVVCSCQSSNCRMKGELPSSTRRLSIIPQSANEDLFANDDWWASSKFLANRYVRDKIIFHVLINFPDSEYLGQFFYFLVQASSADKTKLDFYTLLWLSKEWSSLGMGSTASSVLQQLSGVAMQGIKMANGVYVPPPSIQESSKEAMKDFSSSLSAIQQSTSYLMSLKQEDMTISVLRNISNAMQANQQTYGQYANQQVKLQQVHIQALNDSIEHTVDTLGNMTTGFSNDLQTTVHALQAAVRKETIMDVVSISLGIISGLSSGFMGIARGYSEMSQQAEAAAKWTIGSKFLNGLSQLMKYFSDGVIDIKDQIIDIIKLPDVDNSFKASCADAIQNTIAQLFAGKYVMENLVMLSTGKVISSGILYNISTILLDVGVDLREKVNLCIDEPLQNLKQACTQLGVDCGSVAADGSAIANLASSLASQTNNLINLLYQQISLRLNSQMYADSANEWSGIVSGASRDKNTIEKAVSQQYFSLTYESIVMSNSLVSTCLAFAYMYGIQYTDVDSACGYIPQFVNGDSLSTLAAYLNLEQTANALRNRYMSSYGSSRWQGKGKTFLPIPNLSDTGPNSRHSSSPAGFDLSSFKTMNSSANGHMVFSAVLYIPDDPNWLRKYLNLVDIHLVAKLAAIRVVFNGLKTTCSDVHGTITSHSLQSYRPKGANNAVSVSTYSSMQSFQYSLTMGDYFTTTPTFCELEPGTNCDGHLQFPTYAILPLFNGAYTITLSDFGDCHIDVSSVESISMDYQAFVRASLSSSSGH
eukprot:Nk52_evm13s317 gene=Nk52_evmTU13s317